MRGYWRSILFVALVVGSVATIGCSKKEEPTEPAPAEPTPAEKLAKAEANKEAVSELLAKVDPPEAEPPRRFHDVHFHINDLGVPLVIELLKSHGLDRAVNLSGGHMRRGFERGVAVIEATEGRFLPFFNIDWRRLDDEGEAFGTNIAADLRKAVEAGYAGVKISKALGLRVEYPEGTLLPVDSPILDPIFATAGELGVPVSIHTGDPKAFFEPIDEHNERYAELAAHPKWSFYGDEFPSREELLAQRDRLVAKHPKTHFIGVHFGNNPEDLSYVRTFLDTHPNGFVDISARLGEIGRHDAKAVRQLFIDHKERILFGTDFMLFVSKKRGVSVVLGSSGDDDAPEPGPDDVAAFFDAHWRYLETADPAMPNPVPIQGEWDIYPIDLPDDVLTALYTGNADRLIFEPWNARHGDRFVRKADTD